jgi:hypothetical protein
MDGMAWSWEGGLLAMVPLRAVLRIAADRALRRVGQRRHFQWILPISDLTHAEGTLHDRTLLGRSASHLAAFFTT